ncbi:MAG TPA: flagellar hook protein FlgE [Sulfuricella sp.]|nr:flagellar hook protein FlgE [Sulfuricella sp.]
MGFEQGLSGLNTSSKSLDVIGNNVANAGTVGFKGAEAQFADVFAASLNGGGTAAIGIGTKLATVAQQFTQGNVTATNNPLDMAINGAGFFRMSQNGAITYSRNGQFQMDKNGYLVNSNGLHLTGYDADATGKIIPTNPVELQFTASKQSLPPSQTTKVAVGLNLDSGATVPVSSPLDINNPLTFTSSTSASVYDSLGNSHVFSTYFVKTAVPGTWDVHATLDGVLDTPAAVATVKANTAALGTGGAGANSIDTRALAVQAAWPTTTSAPYVAAANAITAAAAATAAAGALAGTTPPDTPVQILAAVNAAKAAAAAMALMNNAVIASNPTPGAQQTEAPLTLAANTAAQTAVAATVIPAVTLATNQLTFNSAGALTTTMPFGVTLDLNTVDTVLGKTNAATSPLTFNLDYTGSSQYGTNFGVNTLTQDGFSAGNLAGFNVSTDGTIQGRYTNGQSKNLGQLVLADFANPQGLQPLGNNQWAQTPESGQALEGTGGSGKFGVLQSAAVEGSNVDLTAELVNMITAQRIYQANAQTIKTQDAVMQTLVNLR